MNQILLNTIPLSDEIIVHNVPAGDETYFGTQLKEIGYVNQSDCNVLADAIEYSKTATNPDKWKNDKKLIICPAVDTSERTDFSSMFSSCSSLSIVPQLDTSKGTSFNSMFVNCSSLTTIPQLDTSKGTSFDSMFYNCKSLTTIEDIDFTNDQNPPTSQSDSSGVFYNCSKLTNLTINGVINNNKSFYDCPLSSDSIKSVLTAANKTTNTDAKNLWFKETTITDDAEGTFTTLVSECTSKGWTISGLTINPAA